MIRTRGLTHVALKVGDLDRAIAFYATLLDARVLIRNDRTAEIGTPGALMSSRSKSPKKQNRVRSGPILASAWWSHCLSKHWGRR